MMSDLREPAALIDTPFAYGASGLSCSGRPLAELAERHGTPLFVYSETAITDAYRRFSDAAAGENSLICYALKANPNIAVIRLLAGLGAGFDIVSLGELQRVLAAGGRADRVVFSGVGKRADEIRAALEAGIKCINVESEAELHLISRIAVDSGIEAPISLRVNPDIDAQTHPYISTGLRNNKFGIPMQDALRLYRDASRLPGLAVHGLDCHIGSQITSLQPFLDSLDRVLDLAATLHREGIVIQHLDLGGGLGIRYADENPPTPGDMLRALFHRIREWSQSQEITMPEVLFEFGRAIVGNAGVLLTRVELLKPGVDHHFAVIDAAMNDLMRPALYDAWHEVVRILPPGPSSLRRRWDLVGPVCESGDWIARGRELDLADGDILAILSAGAYGMSMSSNYNSRPRAAEVLVDPEGGDHVIRRRETFQDQILAERVPLHLLDPS
jgi:diaminopimelate decarboxylase